MNGSLYSHVSDEESVSFEPLDDGDISESISVKSNTSLLERIQMQKMAQSQGFTPDTNVAKGNNDEIHTFNDSMEEDRSYTYATSAEADINVPDYSYTSSRGNIGNPYHEDDTSNIQSTLFNIVSTVGSAAGSIAKSAYKSTRNIVSRAMNDRTANNPRGGLNRIDEMDYQRESLLMDPHDIDDPSSTRTAGLRGFDGTALNGRDEGGYSSMTYSKQICIDMKDLFLGASRNVQIIIVLFIVFVIWLLISEEEKWFK